MTLHLAITRFKSACDNPDNQAKIRDAIDTQYYRNTWEIINAYSRIRIQDGSNPYLVISICTFINPDGPNTYDSQTFNLTPDQYRDLEAYFFKDYVPDYEYLKSIGVLIK